MNSKRYGLIGNPLSHSFSQSFFTKKFEDENINATYSNFELADLSGLKAKMLSENISGFNVTIPFKESIIPLLDEIDDEAAIIGAVNTVKIVDSKMIGFNTDVWGFEMSVKPFIKSRHEKALILGTGGASLAVVHVLKKIGIDFLFVSRSKKDGNNVQYSDLAAPGISHFKLIINTTPVGMYPNVSDSPDIPYEGITDQHLLMDLIYNPSKTEFLNKGELQGASILNGESMLQLQAEKAWEIWNS